MVKEMENGNGKRIGELVEELKGMESSRWKDVVERGVEYIEEREVYGDEVDIKEYEGVVDYIRYLVYGVE